LVSATYDLIPINFLSKHHFDLLPGSASQASKGDIGFPDLVIVLSYVTSQNG